MREGEETRYIGVIEREGTLVGKRGEGFERVTEPAWSPDGRWIAYIAHRGGDYDVYVEAAP